MVGQLIILLLCGVYLFSILIVFKFITGKYLRIELQFDDDYINEKSMNVTYGDEKERNELTNKSGYLVDEGKITRFISDEDMTKDIKEKKKKTLKRVVSPFGGYRYEDQMSLAIRERSPR